MAVLTRDAIFAELEAGRLRIAPFSRDQVGAASIDLTLGDEIRVMDRGTGPIDIQDGEDFRDHAGRFADHLHAGCPKRYDPRAAV